ncbi:hypothetical protein OHA77_19880 [Streptosporangium sp. NBC_01639]|uniref:hypothetical protein n=1 Tax=Streptosporangium sp. NBC_01639 TaxID=2975948 RepID=UPI0038700F15|nr:hypothetical protein OHA77_19880 [Streptosporangium sp. NBC_01639]
METHQFAATGRDKIIAPVDAAQRLRDELAALEIDADVHDGYGLALVSVWYELVVWTDGLVFRWGSGQRPWRGRPGWHAFAPADDPVTAARRVAGRYAELLKKHPRPEPSTGAPQ